MADTISLLQLELFSVHRANSLRLAEPTLVLYLYLCDMSLMLFIAGLVLHDASFYKPYPANIFVLKMSAFLICCIFRCTLDKILSWKQKL